MSCEWKRSAGFLHVANVHLVLMYHWSHKWKKEVRYRNGYTVEQNGNTYRQNFTLAMRLLSDILLDTAPFFYAMPWKVVDDDLMINRREIQAQREADETFDKHTQPRVQNGPQPRFMGGRLDLFLEVHTQGSHF